MEEKNVTKISLSTFFLILAIITIIIMAIYIYKLNNDKSIEIQKTSTLETQINNLEKKLSSISSILETTTNNNDTVNTSINITFLI